MRSSWKFAPFFWANTVSKDENSILLSSRPFRVVKRSRVVSTSVLNTMTLLYNGKNFKNRTININMLGHKLGEFLPTRKFPTHGLKEKLKKAKEAAVAAAKKKSELKKKAKEANKKK